MKKTKTQKGITLIALIITIVVLLILAVVTINSIQGDGIILKAKQAADNYTAMANDEQTKLNTLLSQIEENTGNGGTIEQVKIATFVQSGTTITGKDAEGNVVEGFSMSVGDTIAYDCYTGVEESKLTYTATVALTGNTTEVEGGDGENKTYTVSSSEASRVWKILGVDSDGKILISTDPINKTMLRLGRTSWV